MKKHVILVSMIVATMFATSCSKDDGDNVEQPVTQEVQNEDNNKSEAQNAESRQIVIKTDNGKILSEVETTDGYNFTFSKGNKLVLTDGETTYATLEMEGEAGSSSATFKGEISTKADNKSIYAVIAGQSPLSEVKTSTESLADVVQSNCYFKSEKFDYNANRELSVTLNDQNAYLVFEVSENQKKVNIGSEWYDAANGKLFAAVPAGEVSGRFFGTKKANSSEIYTITRTDVVDLGVGNVLWKTANETGGTATSYYQQDHLEYANEKYYTWSNAKDAFGTVDEPKEGSSFRLPTIEELAALKELCKEGFVSVSGMSCKEFSNDNGALFFPAAGFYGGDFAGEGGDYWSSSPGDDFAGYRGDPLAYLLCFFVGYADVNLASVDSKYSVRLVRGL